MSLGLLKSVMVWCVVVRRASTRDFIPRHYHIVTDAGTLSGVNEASFLVHIVQAYTFKPRKPTPQEFQNNDKGFQRACASYNRRLESGVWCENSVMWRRR